MERERDRRRSRVDGDDSDRRHRHRREGKPEEDEEDKRRLRRRDDDEFEDEDDDRGRRRYRIDREDDSEDERRGHRHRRDRDEHADGDRSRRHRHRPVSDDEDEGDGVRVGRRSRLESEPLRDPSRKRKEHTDLDVAGGEKDPERDGKRAKGQDERKESRHFEYSKNPSIGRDGDVNLNGDASKSAEMPALNGGGGRSGSSENNAQESPKAASVVSMMPTDSHKSSSAKVSSVNTPNENEGARIRIDEVTGKSSTDRTSSGGKSGSLSSLDALAKAKKALQLKKDLDEKMKKISALGKVGLTNSDNSSVVLSKVENRTPITAAVTHPSSGASVAIKTSAQPSSSLSSGSSLSTAMGGTASSIGASMIPGLNNVQNLDAVKRAQELAAKMGFRQDPEFAPLINMFPGSSIDTAISQRPAKAPVLRLDPQGREIDEHGNVINVTKPTNLSTLKVNINKQKKEAFQIIRPDLDNIGASSSHFDENMGINKQKLLRPKRPGFQFVEEGRLSKLAELQRIKSQFGEAQARELKVKQAQLAKAKSEVDINPNLIAVAAVRIPKQKLKDEIPEVEWWDKQILLSGSYEDMSREKLNMEKITIYVEHPRPIEPPAEPAPPPPQPLKLTKKEQKKLRTQRRIAREKDKQEMIRQGLLEPPKPKIKMSNLMRVLGAEATQDPTRLEMEVKNAQAEREQAHVDRNIARKLTPAERREKKERKLFDDPNTLESIVSVYKIKDLSHPQTRFKVDVNAQENRLTGCIVISDGMTVVVVEGGKKSIKRYGKLMLHRIDWASAVGGELDTDEGHVAPSNSCLLVWQGSVAKPSFNKFIVHQCRSEAAARKVFADAGVPHYWDLSVNFTEELS